MEKVKKNFQSKQPVVPISWEIIPFYKAVSVLSDKGKRIKQKEYLQSGEFPIIDQGQDYIGGYTNNKNLVFDGNLPVIVFGDHTRAVKCAYEPFAVGADGIKILRPENCYSFKFFYYLLTSLQIPSRGYSRHFQFLRNFYLPLPPFPEQHRIVAEIEKQFSRLDEAVAGLKRIQANLKRYRASVLKVAVEGKLTAEWRKQHPDTEPAEQLLQRILKERRAHWEQAELEKMQAAGKPPKDDQWKQKYKEPVAQDVSDLPVLPEGWVWATISQVGDIQLGKMLDRQKYQSGYELPYLRNINIRWNAVDTTDVFKMFFRDHEIERFGIKPGDVLVCEGGEPGRAAIWNGLDSEMKYQKALHRVRFLTGYEPKLLVFSLEYLAKSGKLEYWFTGSTIKHFTRESFSTLTLSIPPLAEQTQIVSEVERRLSIADEVEQQINTNMKRAERLRQSILKKAFSGRLVPQDTNDEPASVLLEKIKQAQCA